MRADKLRIWLLTDVFPPKCGGSGWSTFYLGKALAERGHEVRVLRPRYGEKIGRARKRVVEYGGLAVTEMLVPPPPGWAVRAGFGKAWSQTKAARLLARRAFEVARLGEADVLHGQHMVSVMAASSAARHARSVGRRVVSVGTVRDYWPLCPSSTRLFVGSGGGSFECKDCHQLSTYLACVGESKGGVAARALAPARWANTLAAAESLARCEAVIAVSDYVREELARSRRIAPGKLATIPNLVDIASVEQALSGRWPLHDISPKRPFLLFVGKLEMNKGPQMLPDALARAGVRLPVVLAGDGPLRSDLEAEARRRGLDFRFYDWLDNDAVLLLMRQARVLLFPSAWQEPLSRVLIEGCAAGAAIVALNTGGTSDIITDGESGWLAEDVAGFASGIKRVVEDDALNARLRSGARRRAEQKFSSKAVCREVEDLYRRLLGN